MNVQNTAIINIELTNKNCQRFIHSINNPYIIWDYSSAPDEYKEICLQYKDDNPLDPLYIIYVSKEKINDTSFNSIIEKLSEFDEEHKLDNGDFLRILF
jgi:hypothetical protein